MARAGLAPAQVVRHTLRHTAVSHVVQAGVDLPTVQRVSGHKTLAMVVHYAHQDGAHVQAAMDKLEGRIAGAITQELHKSKRPPRKGWPKCLIFLVGCEWLEHSTYGLRVRCSTN